MAEKAKRVFISSGDNTKTKTFFAGLENMNLFIIKRKDDLVNRPYLIKKMTRVISKYSTTQDSVTTFKLNLTCICIYYFCPPETDILYQNQIPN